MYSVLPYIKKLFRKANGIDLNLLPDFQAKNERDPSAISALMQALKLDPGNQEAIIALAASLTNESMQSQACYALQGQYLIDEKFKGKQWFFAKDQISNTA